MLIVGCAASCQQPKLKKFFPIRQKRVSEHGLGCFGLYLMNEIIREFVIAKYSGHVWHER